MCRRPVALLVPLLVAFATLTSSASAFHAEDARHSTFMTQLFNSPDPTGAVTSDLAFWGTRAYVGNYNGFRIFDISNPERSRQLVDFRCYGPQNDPIVWRNQLLFLAVDQPLNAPECEATDPDAPPGDPRAIPPPEDPRAWEGVRIFDVSNPTNPRLIKGVYTDCGAHTITLFPKSHREILIYVSSYPLDPGPTCGLAGRGRDPIHGVIQVISVPVKAPHKAREIAEPRIVYPGDPDNQYIWAEHALPPPPAIVPGTRACHDIGVFVELRLAAGACLEQGQLWRIGRNGLPDTENPIWAFDDTLDETGTTGRADDPGVVVDFFHSATFSWDGKIVNFIDESFGLGCPPTTPVPGVEAAFPGDTGRMFFVDTATGQKLSHFMLPRPESAPQPDPETGQPVETAYCSAHLGNTVPSPDRYLLVNAWYMGGADVIDFTDPRNPFELAFFDLNPFGPTGSDNWSAYWYEGPIETLNGQGGLTIYATDGVHNPATGRGFQVLFADRLREFSRLGRLNPQTQERTFPTPTGATAKATKAKRAQTRAAGGARQPSAVRRVAP
jgi:hypothetical protein